MRSSLGVVGRSSSAIEASACASNQTSSLLPTDPALGVVNQLRRSSTHELCCWYPVGLPVEGALSLARILVITDERSASEPLSNGLHGAGFEVLVHDARFVYPHILLDLNPDLVVIDYAHATPNFELCRSVMSLPAADIPFVVISSSRDELDRLVALEVGADDYMNRPYNSRELELRLRRSLGRHRVRLGTPASSVMPVAEGAIHVGSISVDVRLHRVWAAGKELELSLSEFRLLAALCKNQYRIMTLRQLAELAWGNETSLPTSAIRSCIKRLRRHLGQCGSQINRAGRRGYYIGDAVAAIRDSHRDESQRLKQGRLIGLARNRSRALPEHEAHGRVGDAGGAR